MEGTVKWFNRKKGFGFIEGEDGEDYFVHHSALAQGTFIRDNDIVSFENVETDKGKQAQNVTLLRKGSEIAAEAGEGSEEAPTEKDSEEQPEETSKEEPAEEPAEEETSKEEQPEETSKEEPAEEVAEEEAPAEEKPAEEVAEEQPEEEAKEE